MKFEKIGMRTIKTALAVSLTIFFARLLNLESPFFAGIAAIITMQTSVSESFTVGKNRMYGTILGAIVALLFSYFVRENLIFIALGIIIIIYSSNLFGWKKSVQLSTIVFLSILLNYEEGRRLAYALNRTLDTLFGLVTGSLINYFILPPKVEGKLKEAVDRMYGEFIRTTTCLLEEKERASLTNLENCLKDLEANYLILKKDHKLNLYSSEDYIRYDCILRALKRAYTHLDIIFTLEISPCLNKSNMEQVEKILHITRPCTEFTDGGEPGLIYNYHFKEMLKNLDHVKDLLQAGPCLEK